MTTASQHVVIIGGTSGIGLETARRLAGDGYRVTVAGRNEDRLAAAREALDGKVEARPLDAADKAQVSGFLQGDRPARSSRPGLRQRTRNGSVRDARSGGGARRLRRQGLVAPILRSDRAADDPQGRLDHFHLGGFGQMAAPGTVGLAAVNGALAVVTPVLAAELRPLRVNAVTPGVVDTPWWDFMGADQRRDAFADFAGRTPVGRVGAPDDIAKAIAFLIGNDFVTGHVLTCDGGLRLGA